MKSNYWICVNGDCVATAHTMDWAMEVADGLAERITGSVTVNDYQGQMVYTVTEL